MVLDSIFDAVQSAGGRFLLYGQTDDRRLVLGRSEAISTIQHVLQEFIAPSSTTTGRTQTSAVVSAIEAPSTTAAAIPPISDSKAPLENEDVSCQEFDVVFGDPRRTHHAGNRRLEGKYRYQNLK
jgi:hypothetical protein